jgi:hypothetical protein
LAHEERIACGLLLNELGQRCGGRGRLMQRVCHELRDFGNAKRVERDRLHRHALIYLLLHGQHERVVRRHFGIAIRENQQQRFRRAGRYDSRDEV